MQTLKVPYFPYKEQLKFHNSPAKVKLFRGGVGAGKTLAGAAESLIRSIKNPDVNGMIVAPFHNLLHRVTLKAFLDLCPKELISQHEKTKRAIILKNGTHIFYGSADRPETLEGSNLGWLWGDELRYWKKASYNISLARVRVPCPYGGSFFTTTPDMGWLFSEFGNREKDGEFFDEIHSSSLNNPHLPKDFHEVLRRSYPEDLFDAYVKGLWVRLTGNVFVIKDEFQIEEDLYNPLYPVDVAFDPGFRKSAVLFVQRIQKCEKHGGKECFHVLDEIMPNEKPTTEIAELIKMRLYAMKWKTGFIFADPAANSRQTADGMSDVKALRDAGFKVKWTTDPTKRLILTGIRLIQSLLFEGRLFFSPLLQESERGILTALRNSEYEKNSELPVKDGTFDHARDALRYYLVNNTTLPSASFAGWGD